MFALRLQSLSEGFLACYTYPDTEYLFKDYPRESFTFTPFIRRLAVEYDEISLSQPDFKQLTSRIKGERFRNCATAATAIYDTVLYVFYDLSKALQRGDHTSL